MTKVKSATENGYVTNVDKADMAGKARKGIKWSAVQIIARNVLSLGTTAVLARLLSPGDFGLVGMVATLTALLQIFSDMGLSWATIQSQQLSKDQISNLFWINTGVGLLLWGICILGAPGVASFYGEQELIGITAVLGVSFLLSGSAAQPIALLNRTMNYKAAAQIEVFSIIAGCAAALVSAFWGAGYWALVIQSVVNAAVRALLAFPMSGITIFFPRKDVGTRKLVTFGGLMATSGLFNYLACSLDSVLVGKYWGAEALGFYNRAYFLMLLPSVLSSGVLTKVMVAALSVINDDQERFAAVFRKGIKFSLFVGCPMALGLILTADEMVFIIYGAQWQPTVPIFMWLSIISIAQPINNAASWLFTAAGKAKAYLYFNVIAGLILGVCFYFAAPWGTLAIARVNGIVMGFGIISFSLWLSHRVSGLSLKETVLCVLPVAPCLFLMAVSVLIIEYACELFVLGFMATLVLKVFAGVVSYILFSFMFMGDFLRKDIIPFLWVNK
ncbi:lipopolysaccharide biosynthesis protein [Zobellella maritima]|uniref:lipopolysaccharide biosynthesis protein n=1 Tax=Zobellella maritima TaxID=2059725 RepID=UPI000E302567|nr:lipopolysaccharide biosynthesis protein [Zobellella maritima]